MSDNKNNTEKAIQRADDALAKTRESMALAEEHLRLAAIAETYQRDDIRELLDEKDERIAKLEADSKRLAWILQFMGIEDVGDEHIVAGVRTLSDQMDDELFGVLSFNATVMDFIDQAIDRAMKRRLRKRNSNDTG